MRHIEAVPQDDGSQRPRGKLAENKPTPDRPAPDLRVVEPAGDTPVRQSKGKPLLVDQRIARMEQEYIKKREAARKQREEREKWAKINKGWDTIEDAREKEQAAEQEAARRLAEYTDEVTARTEVPGKTSADLYREKEAERQLDEAFERGRGETAFESVVGGLPGPSAARAEQEAARRLAEYTDEVTARTEVPGKTSADLYREKEAERQLDEAFERGRGETAFESAVEGLPGPATPRTESPYKIPEVKIPREYKEFVDRPVVAQARAELVAAYAELRKYTHGLTSVVRKFLRKNEALQAQERYSKAQERYREVLRDTIRSATEELGERGRAQVAVYALERKADETAEAVAQEMGESKFGKLYKFWNKLGEIGLKQTQVGKWLEGQLAYNEFDNTTKKVAKTIGRFVTGMANLRTALAFGVMGGGGIMAYAGWRVASAAATGAGFYGMAREGLRVESLAIDVKGSEAKLNKEYTDADLAAMDDRDLGELMKLYGSHESFYGRKITNNETYKRVKAALASRLEMMETRLEGEAADDAAPERRREVAIRAEMLKGRLDIMDKEVETELGSQEKKDRRQRLVAAAGALAVGGALMYWHTEHGTAGGTRPEPVGPPHPGMVPPEPLPHPEPLPPEPVPAVPTAPTPTEMEPIAVHGHVDKSPYYEFDDAKPKAPDAVFEKFTDDQPLRFKVAGIRGEAVFNAAEGGEDGTVELRHAIVDRDRVAQYLDPKYKEGILRAVQGDAASAAVMQEQAYGAVEQYTALEGLHEDLVKRGLADSPMGRAVQRQMHEIVTETNERFPHMPVFREVSDFSATAGDLEAPTAVAMNVDAVNPDTLAFPSSWDEQTVRAARDVLTYQQVYADTLQGAVGAYKDVVTNDSHFAAFAQKAHDVRFNMLYNPSEPYSVQDILTRISDNNPGKVPTVELVPGAVSVEQTARLEALDMAEKMARSFGIEPVPVPGEAASAAAAAVPEAGVEAGGGTEQAAAEAPEVNPDAVNIREQGGVWAGGGAKMLFQYRGETPMGMQIDLSDNADWNKFILTDKSTFMSTDAQEKLAGLTGPAQVSARNTLERLTTGLARYQFAHDAMVDAGLGNTPEARFLEELVNREERFRVPRLGMTVGEAIGERLG